MEPIKKKNFLRSITDKFKDYNSKVKWPIFICVAVFSTVQWIDIFGETLKSNFPVTLWIHDLYVF